MSFHWGEHVGELELRIEAESERDVFADAVLAFGELLGGDEPAPAATEARELRADGEDRALLLADLLDELIFLAEVDGFVPSAVERLQVAERSLEARLAGHCGQPPHLVKAVTLHGLAFEPAARGWRANALLDV